MDEPLRVPVRVPFGELEWTGDDPGIRAWEVDVEGACEPSRASEGEAFLLPAATLGDGAHRGRNLSPGPTRLLLIDDHREG